MPQVRKEEIANKIVEVATEQFYERGFKATTMRDIAAESSLCFPAY